MNILTTENLAKHNTKNRTAGVGEWKLRNGVWAMDIRPEPFYQNYTVDGTKISYCLKEEFHDGQYIFNLWIDADDVNNGSGSYSQAGFNLYYSDGTSVSLRVTGAENKGFQHKYFISDASKKCDRLNVYYSRSLPTYYRYDSYIIPLNKTSSKFLKTGQVFTGDFIEDYTHTHTHTHTDSTDSMQLYQGAVHTGEFIEF